MRSVERRTQLVVALILVLMLSGILAYLFPPPTAEPMNRAQLISLFELGRAARFGCCGRPDLGPNATWIGEHPVEELNQIIGQRVTYQPFEYGIDRYYGIEVSMPRDGVTHTHRYIVGRGAPNKTIIGELYFTNYCISEVPSNGSMHPGETGVVSEIQDRYINFSGEFGEDGLADLIIVLGDPDC